MRLSMYFSPCWMQSFFEMEAIRGIVGALRTKGSTVSQASKDGKAVCEIAIQVWNKKREWQVHRSDCWIEDFIAGTLRKCGHKGACYAKD